jgi:hypothetical protein
MCASRFTRIILPRTKSPLLGLILGISDEYRMNKIEIGKNRRRIDLNRVCILVFLCVAQFSQAQTIAQDKMQQLQYMIGEWEGTSKQIKDGVVVSEVPASESIKYGLNKHIITIDLTSENLLLHTVIIYDEVADTYLYHPFSMQASGKYPAEFENGRLIVSPTETVRYIFTQTPEGNFIEYGEKLIDGHWERYFEDTFWPSE